VTSKSQPATPADAVLAHNHARGLVLLDQLMAPTLSEEWGLWLHEMQTLEAQWFAPLLAALKSGKLRSARFILTGGETIAEYTATAASLRKFWVNPGLSRLSA